MNFQRRDFLSAGAAVATMTAAGAALGGLLAEEEARLADYNARNPAPARAAE
jgi:anaerobic selenocysteine-containing dehydrogenase